MGIRTIIVDATAPRKRFENSEGDAASGLFIGPVTFAYRGAERIPLYQKNFLGHCASMNDKQGDAIETSGLRFVTYLSCDSIGRRGTAESPRKVPANGLAALAQIYLYARPKTRLFYVACPRRLKGSTRSRNFSTMEISETTPVTRRKTTSKKLVFTDKPPRLAIMALTLDAISASLSVPSTLSTFALICGRPRRSVPKTRGNKLPARGR